MKNRVLMVGLLWAICSVGAAAVEPMPESDRPVCNDSEMDDPSGEQYLQDFMFVSSFSSKDRANAAALDALKDYCKSAAHGIVTHWADSEDVMMASCIVSEEGRVFFQGVVVSFRNARTASGGIRKNALVMRGGMDNCVRILPLKEEASALHQLTRK